MTTSVVNLHWSLDNAYCYSYPAPFNPLNPASTSKRRAVFTKFTTCASAAKPEFLNADSTSREIGTHAICRRTSTTSLARRRRCYLSLNESPTPKSETTEKESVSSEQAVLEQSVQSHLDLLQQFTSERSLNTAGTGKTISQQLAENLELEEAEELTVPLGTGKVEMEPLTISQKRNIRRQDYLNKVSQRNDAPFFTTVALFVIVPPVVILGVAVATGYVDLGP